MIGGLACLVAIVPFRMYLLTPRALENTTTLERVEAIEGQNRRALVVAARGGGDLEENLFLYERHVAKLEELIPAAEEVPALANDIAATARQAGVEVQRLNPEPPETGTFYNRTSYDMAVIGEYHAVAQFLTNVASLSRIVTPVEVDVALFDQPARFSEMESPVIANFRIETYVLPDPAAIPVAEAPGG